MTAVTLYGISNCDTIKKARTWLQQRGVAFEFHDYRKHGLTPELAASMADALGWEAMLNRRGSSWRKLPESVRQDIDRDGALAAMLQNPALIKRPVLARGDEFHVGFDDLQYREIFDQA